MYPRTCTLLTVLVVLLSLSASARAASDFESLLARVPQGANALVLIDASQVFASQMAQQEDWQRNYAKKFDAAPSMLPPTTDKFVWAAELDLKYLQPNWQVALMRLSRDLSMPGLAKWRRGTLDSVAGYEAAAMPSGAMVVKFSTEEYGAIVPGTRQKAARWVKQSGSPGGAPALSSFLQSVVADAAGKNVHMVQALDLTDSLDRDTIKRALFNSEVVKQAGLDIDDVANLLASVRGVAATVQFADRASGRLVVDFETSVSVLGDSAKPMLLEILNEAGASFDELPDWDVSLGEQQIVLAGEWTEGGLMRLFSFLDMHPSTVDDQKQRPAESETDESDEPAPVDEPSLVRQTTHDHFQSVQKYLRDLSRERGASSYYTKGVWFEKYAKRIERLPILHVDPQMLDYSESVIGHLRGAAGMIRAGGVKAGAQGAQVQPAAPGYYDYNYGYSGYPVFSGGANYAASQVANVEAERRAIRAQEKATSTLDTQQHMAAIQDETLAIRRQMTEKYQLEF